MPNLNSKFIILEGVDGSGKSAIANDIKLKLQKVGRKVSIANRSQLSENSVFNDVVKSIINLFEHCETEYVPFDMLLTAAALQNCCIFHSQIEPKLAKNSVVIVDSWWSKTSIHLQLEAQNKEQSSKLSELLSPKLLECLDLLVVSRYEEISKHIILIEASAEDRWLWYSSSNRKEWLNGEYCSDKNTYLNYTEKMQNRLRLIAEQKKWPVVRNGNCEGISSVSEKILHYVDEQ